MQCAHDATLMAANVRMAPLVVVLSRQSAVFGHEPVLASVIQPDSLWLLAGQTGLAV